MGVRIPPVVPLFGAIMYKKLDCCKYCKLPFINLTSSERANHSRWCIDNPKRPEYVIKNNGSQFNTPDVIAKRNAGIKKAWASGKYDNVDRKNFGHKHSEETKKIISEKARASTHRRLIRSLRNYIKTDGTSIMLDSAWEEALAKRLDELGINWIRPPAIKWIDSKGTARNYFPDFYLPDYNLYLDPKNPYAIKSQQEKINCLMIQIKNLVIITSLNECKTYQP